MRDLDDHDAVPPNDVDLLAQECIIRFPARPVGYHRVLLSKSGRPIPLQPLAWYLPMQAIPEDRPWPPERPTTSPPTYVPSVERRAAGRPKCQPPPPVARNPGRDSGERGVCARRIRDRLFVRTLRSHRDSSVRHERDGRGDGRGRRYRDRLDNYHPPRLVGPIVDEWRHQPDGRLVSRMRRAIRGFYWQLRDHMIATVRRMRPQNDTQPLLRCMAT
uniref:Uncharacterized protein n=1 Tax=Anopheles melas TaxID=34690 RepID=A0A182U3C6_9DIPT